MIGIICDVIDCIRYVLQLISLVNVFAIHYAHQSLEDGVEVGIQQLDASLAQFAGVDEQMLKGTYDQIGDSLMFITMCETLIDEGLKVSLVSEDQVGYEL